MPAPRLFDACLAAALLLALAGCGGPVAQDAPGLLTLDEIAARAAVTADTTRGLQAESELRNRGAQLRARAAQIRRAGLPVAERQSLISRADQLKLR